MRLILILSIMLACVDIVNAAYLNGVDIETCKNSPLCNVCFDDTSNSIALCQTLPVYDVSLQKGNPIKLSQLCNLPSQKEICLPQPAQYEIIDDRLLNKILIEKSEDGFSWGSTWITINNTGKDIGVTIESELNYGESYSSDHSFSLLLKNTETVSSSKIIVNGLTWNSVSLNESKTIYLGWRTDVNIEISYQVKTTADGYKYICPSNEYKPCMEESSSYYCNRSDCFKSEGLDVSETDNATQDDLQQGEWAACSLDEVSLFTGRHLSCRKGSATTPLKNCCKSVEPDEEMQKMLKYGAYTAVGVNPILALATGFGAIMELFGEHNVIKEWINAATSWLSGGICEEAEIALSTLKASGPNNGNCVKLGEICSDYRGTWGKIAGKCWYTEIKCDRVAEVYCCFDDMMAKATGKAARTQLGIGWGTDEDGNLIKNADSIRPGGNPCNPDKKRFNFDCRGITIPEMISLNLNTEEYRNDIRDYAEHLVSKLIDKDGKPIGKLQEIINDNSIADKLYDSLK